MPAKVRVEPPANFSRLINSRSAFASQIAEVSHQKASGTMRAIANAAVQEAETRARQLYKPRQDSDKKNRRRYPNAPHLHTSFKCEISGSRKAWPIVITLSSDAPAAAINALNRGSKPHVISPGRKGVLYFPRTGLMQSYSFQRTARGTATRLSGLDRLAAPKRFLTSSAANAQARPKGAFVRTFEPVHHPGISASYFMELAVERAVERVLRKTVRLPRQ